MKFAMAIVVLGYIVIVAMFGWWGIAAAALHIGSILGFSRRK